MRPLRTEANLQAAADALVRIEPAFGPVRARAGDIPLRYRPPGFEGLASIIVAQMVSRAAADAIWRRLDETTGGVRPGAILARSPEELRAAGLSGAKETSLRRLAEACRDGLDLEKIATLDAATAIAELTAVKGIGLWTAEVFLLFSAGHPDIFPSGDVALQTAAMQAFALAERPGGKQVRAMAVRWQPHRSIAARLLWAYYAVERRRDAAPVA